LAYQEGEYHILDKSLIRQNIAHYLVDESVEDLEQTSLDHLFKVASQGLSLAHNALFKVITLKDKKGNQALMILAHHLLVDGVSWRILLPQLKALVLDQKASLSFEETGINSWSKALYEQVPSYRKERDFWQTILQRKTQALAPKIGKTQLAHKRVLLAADVSQSLLKDFSQETDVSVEEALLAAVSASLLAHSQLDLLKVNLESHGREDIKDDIKVSQTLGWFTTEYPVLIEPGDGADMPSLLKNVKQALRSVPDKGLGFASLRYLDTDYQATFSSLEKANPSQLLFNYLGRFDARQGYWQAQQRDGVFADSFAVHLDAEQVLLHEFEVNIFVDESGEIPQLAIHWSWDQAQHSQAEILQLSQAIQSGLEQMIVWSQAAKTNLKTTENQTLADQTRVAADLTQKGLSNTQLAQLENSYGPVLDVLPALPLQEGLLFHAQLGGAGSHYNSTTRLSIEGQVQVSAIQMALNTVIVRHPQLLAHFDSNVLGRAIQILPKKMSEWPLTQEDFSTLERVEQDRALMDFEQKELTHEFDLYDANQPLIRASLIKLDETRYRLFVSAHHLVVDGWSTPILLRDFLLTYAGLSHELTPIKVDYPSVVAKLSQRNKQDAIHLWQTVLDACQPSIAFEDVPVQHQVNEITITLSQEKTQALNAHLREFGLTLNTLMQGIWASVLGTMTGREDVVFGTPISGRFGAIEGIDEHIGLFSNTIPVRVALTAKSSLLSQLGALQERQIQLLENDVLGLAEIQRLAGSDTLFDTLLVVENYPDNSDWYAKDYQGTKLTHIHNRGYTHYPLTLLVLPSDELHILIEYRDTVGIAQQVAQRLEKILDDIIIAPNKPLAQWDLRLEHEVAINHEVNQTSHELEASDLSTLMMRQAQKTPNALALQDEHRRYCYQDMRAQVLGIAALLQGYQIGEGDIVAVALPRSATLSLAFNSILELGAAYLPLDVAYPDDRLAYMVDDAKPKLIITMGEYQHRFAALGELILFDQLPEPITETATLIQARRSLNPESGAYIIYTSGSTGKPKGVLVSHKAIVNRLHWMQSEYPLNTKDVILQKTPCSFDVSVWEFFWPLIEGASVMMAPPESHKDPEALLRIIEDYQVTTLHFVPSMLAAFMASISVRFKQGDHIATSLKQVFSSGEALSKALSRHYGQYLNAPLHNLYGPTEAAVDVSYCQAYGDALHESHGSSVPIGLPVWNTQLYVLDSFLREVPIGVPGELYLAGEQLAIGYLNRAGLTADRFIANPFNQGQRMYRTGDVVRWLASGKVEYLGRSDDQLKIRGQRIELGEIETALAELAGVKQALVCAKTLNKNDNALTGADSRQLVAYVIPQADITLAPSQLRVELSETLPAHMVPVVVMVLSDFPLSANGKLDRNALPLPHDLANPQGRGPSLGLETALAKLFSKVLGCDEVSAEDDFFALGGHSLLAMQLSAEIRKNLDIPVSVGQIMVSPSVEKLALLFSDKDAFNDPSHAGLGGILPIRSGKGIGLFCINSASGFAWQYTGLIKHLKGQYPVHGLQSPRHDGAMADALDMADAASIYLETVKMIQPQGPYHLLGYSFGGNIAHALAVALQAAGEEVAFLGLLDTYPPEGQDWDGPMNEQEQEEIEREKALFLNANNIDDEELSQERLTLFNDIEANYADSVRLLSSAKTGHFTGDANLFIAQRTLPQNYDVDTHWLPYLNGLQKHHLDASHEDMISPENVGDVGIKLKAMLDALGTLTD
jgi:amino acid adenylation domain-containing protein/non-ribosomal peptide synthase protein (TIGR01720 family)